MAAGFDHYFSGRKFPKQPALYLLTFPEAQFDPRPTPLRRGDGSFEATV